jgi:hypothetical protein
LEATTNVGALLREWGWANPPADIVALAEKTLAANGRRAGEILIDWGVITPDECERMIRDKPEKDLVLEFFSSVIRG